MAATKSIGVVLTGELEVLAKRGQGREKGQGGTKMFRTSNFSILCPPPPLLPVITDRSLTERAGRGGGGGEGAETHEMMKPSINRPSSSQAHLSLIVYTRVVLFYEQQNVKAS